jgi:hypothetical protein
MKLLSSLPSVVVTFNQPVSTAIFAIVPSCDIVITSLKGTSVGLLGLAKRTTVKATAESKMII